MAGSGARRLNLSAEVEAAADEINFAVNSVGPRKYEEEMGAEDEEETATEQTDNEEGAGVFERARLGSVARGRAGFGSVKEAKSETETSTEAEAR